MNLVQNSVTLIGHLGQNPEKKDTKNGMAMTTFSLATNETYTKEGEKITKTQWHKCVSFGKTAEIILQYTKKGSHVAVMGQISYNNFKDKEGKEHKNTDIKVNSINFLDPKS